MAPSSNSGFQGLEITSCNFSKPWKGTAFSGLLCLLALPAGAAALTVDEAVALALRQNPQLAAAGAQHAAAQSRERLAGTLANPMFTYRGMDANNDVRFPASAEKRLELEQTFPWFGKRGLERAAAKSETAALQADVFTTEQDLALVVRETFFALIATRQALAYTRRELDVLRGLTDLSMSRLATGRGSQTDAIKARTETALLHQKLAELTAQEETLGAKLNALLGRDGVAPVGELAPVSAPARTPLELTRLVETALADRPEMQRAQAEIGRAETEARFAAKAKWPDYKLGVEYRDIRDEDNLVMLSVGVELPLWHGKYAAGEASARQRIAAARANLRVLENQITLEIRQALAGVVGAHESLRLARTAVVPQAEERFKVSEAAVRSGGEDFRELLESQRALLGARTQLAQAEANLLTQWARLERACGGAVPEAAKK
jgi:outer membrane protein TolC